MALKQLGEVVVVQMRDIHVCISGLRINSAMRTDTKLYFVVTGMLYVWIQMTVFPTRFLCVCVCVRTKKLVVDVIRIQPGEALPEILETPATAPQVTFSSLIRFYPYTQQPFFMCQIYMY